jgi:hypothetical protein
MVATRTLGLELVAGSSHVGSLVAVVGNVSTYQALRNALHPMREKAKGQVVQNRLDYVA